MGIVIWFIIVYTVNHCIQWTETVRWVEFRVYALSINDMFAIMYNIQFYCISYLRITNNQTTLQFSSLSRIPHYFPIIPILISPGIHSISQQTNKQTNKQTNNTSFIYTLCAFRWPHFTISKIPFSYYTSLSPSLSHILIAARLHVLRRQTQQLRPLVSLQHRHQPIVLLRRHLPSIPSPSPTFPTIISCSKLDISNDVYTFISGAFSATFAPCLDSSLRLSYTPGRISFSSSGVGRCSSLRETPRESLLLLHRGLLELHVQLLLFRLQTRGHLVYR